MAARGTSKDLSASVLAGSEEVFDFHCQPCSLDNINAEAIGYCTVCCEYLCTKCYSYHRKLSATKHHSLLDKSAMLKTKPTPKVKDILTEKCPTHQDKVLEYFCNGHSEVCCSVCLNMSHRNCSMSYIPEVSDRIAGSQEYQQVKANLDKFVSMVTGHQKHIKLASQDSEKYHSTALADIKKFRKQINLQLDKMEQDAVRKVSQLNKENTNKIKEMSEKCQALLANVKHLSSSIEEQVKLGKNSQLFVGLKLARNRVSDMENELDDIKSCKISRYTFHQDEKLQEVTSTLSSIWSLSVRQDVTHTNARYIRDVNVKSADDTENCIINGIAVLTDDRIVVTDHKNKSLKMVDIKQNTTISHVPLSSPPFDVTLATDHEDQIAVTLPDEEKIEIFTISKTLSRSKIIDVPGVTISGLRWFGNKFTAACQHPGTVKIIYMSGKVLRTFSTDSNGKPLFTTPRFIALSRDHDVLYVTDCDDHTVTCMTVGGKVISVYKHDKLRRPLGVTVDTDDSVYVCSCDTDTVHQLTPTGTLIQILLARENGLAEWPCAIAHNDKDDKLYISSASPSPASCNYVKVFQLE